MNLFESVIAVLIANGFKAWIPGARVTGYLCYFRRGTGWKFLTKEWVFLLNGEWTYSGGRSVYKFGRYEEAKALQDAISPGL